MENILILLTVFVSFIFAVLMITKSESILFSNKVEDLEIKSTEFKLGEIEGKLHILTDNQLKELK